MEPINEYPTIENKEYEANKKSFDKNSRASNLMSDIINMKNYKSEIEDLKTRENNKKKSIMGILGANKIDSFLNTPMKFPKLNNNNSSNSEEKISSSEPNNLNYNRFRYKPGFLSIQRVRHMPKNPSNPVLSSGFQNLKFFSKANQLHMQVLDKIRPCMTSLAVEKHPNEFYITKTFEALELIGQYSYLEINFIITLKSYQS